MLNAVSYVAVLRALAAMGKLPPHAPSTAGWRDAVLGGLRHARADATIRTLLVLSAMAALFARSYQQLLPIFAARVWSAGPTAYGALLSAGGAGALVGAIGLASMRAVEHHARVMLASGFALAAALVLFARAPSLPAGVAVLVVVGIAATVFSTMIATKIQLDVPRALRGRVIGLYTITLIGMPSLGSLAMAAIARRVGAPMAVTFGAAVLAVAMLWGTRALHSVPGSRSRGK
jgi:hypothetical protein